MASEERQFQRWFVKEWQRTGGWVENVHPSFGTKTGIPDVFVLVAKLLVPIEIKVGTIESGVLEVSEIRPAQIRWSRKFSSHGGCCGLIAGVRRGSRWRIGVVMNEHWWSGKRSFSADEFAVVDNVTSAVIHVLAQ